MNGLGVESRFRTEHQRISDGNLIISAIDGLLEEADIAPAGERRFSSQDSGGLTLNVNSDNDGSLYVGVNKVNEQVAAYSRDQYGDEVYELYGQTPIAKSKVGLRVIVNNRMQRITWYMLRGESVRDVPRIEVVRQALGLSVAPQQ